MRKLLLTTAALLAMFPAFAGINSGNAAIIDNLGINPVSSQGDFSNSVGGGAFEDQFTFQLVGFPQFITIASVTNVFPNPTDFITAFTAAVWTTGLDGIVNNADDVAVIGPVNAVACPTTPDCQFIGGTAILNAGNYYLEFTGVGGGTSGYGGNLSVQPVPGPIVGAGIPGLIAACGGLFGLNFWRRRRTA